MRSSLLVVFLRFLLDGLFDSHVVKFFRIKYIATLQALNVLGIFMSGNNSDSRVFAGGSHG